LRPVQRNKRRAPGWGAAQNKARKSKNFSGLELRASARHRQAVGGQAGRAAKLAELQNKAIRGNMSNIKAASAIASRPPMTGLVAREPPAQNKAKKPNDFSQRM
jgi:hypothetical protein